MNAIPSVRHLLCALALGAALPAAAQTTLLGDGGFAQGLNSWDISPNQATSSWSPMDADGSSASGSATIENVIQNYTGEGGLAQCVAVRPGAAYDASAKARIPSGQSTTGNVEVRVTFYADAECSPAARITGGEIRIGGPSVAAGPLDQWTPFAGSGTSPANAKSAKFQVLVAKNEMFGTLTASVDDLALAPGAPQTVVVATSASIHGQAGTFFHSDLWVVNHSHRQSLDVQARYRCQSAFPGCENSVIIFTLEPRESRRFADVVASLFGQAETAGAIELSYDGAPGQLSATSRTYTPSLPAPTNGTSIPAVAGTDATTHALFLGLSSNGPDRAKGFRSNSGAYNPSASPADLVFKLYDANKQLLGSATRTARPYEAFQINDIFASVGAGAAVTTNATLEVTSTAPVFPFVTVIDNQSGDSTYMQPTVDEAP